MVYLMKIKLLMIIALAARGLVASAQINAPADNWKPAPYNAP